MVILVLLLSLICLLVILYNLHSNDTGGLPIVAIKLTGTENYKMWSIAMTFALRNHNKLGFIDGSLVKNHRNVTYVGANKPTATTFAAKTFDDKMRPNNNSNFNRGFGSNSNSNNRGPNPNLKCTICNKIGYIVDRCFELVGYPAGYVKRNFNTSTSMFLVIMILLMLSILMSLLNDNGVSFSNANMAGANQHMTVSAKNLVNVVDISNLGLIVGHPNEYTVCLLSVHKIARDNKLFVEFDDAKLYIQDFRANKTIGICNQCNGLCMFDVDNACKIVSMNCISSYYVSKTLWHQRLGHPVDQVLDVLKSTLNLDSQSVFDHLYDTCNKAKQTREPFPLSDHKSTKISQLVHLDVWGPYKVVSRDGFRYFLTIIYDFSRAVWVYMLKGKDDVYDSIDFFFCIV
ncbi:ribonuclease H-like domain-containing protein [Tanacetum coccineum]